VARRDFALNEAPSRPQGSAVSALMPVLAIVMVALLCFAAGYWFGQTQAPKSQQMDAGDRVSQAEYDNLHARFIEQQKQLDALGVELAKWKALANRDASSRLGELQFYETLPKQPVMPAPLASATAGNPAPEAASPEKPAGGQDLLAGIIGREMQSLRQGEYRIQVGSFRSRSEAAPLRKKLEDAGFASFSEAVDLGEKGRWVRVYVGPFSSRSRAESARRELKERLKISGLLLRRNS